MVVVYGESGDWFEEGVGGGIRGGGGYERAKVVTIFKKSRHSGGVVYVRLYLLDQGTLILARSSMLLFLFAPFGDLPKRVRIRVFLIQDA